MEMTIANTGYLAPVTTLSEAKDRYVAFQKFVSELMVEGRDFGKVPGVSKPSLLKPGAEKLNSFFGLSSKTVPVDSEKDWTGENHGGEPFFYFEYRCDLYRGDTFAASCIGSCNSMEKKYRYRKLERVCPKCGKELRKSKDAPTFYCWKKTDGCGAVFQQNDPEIINQKVGVIKNPDIADQVNTIQKMAQKRAFVGASLIATNASEFFTQDVEDMPRESFRSDVIDGEFTAAPPATHRGQPVTPEGEIIPQGNGNGKKSAFDEAQFLRNFNPQKDFEPMDLAEAQAVESEKEGPYGKLTTEQLFYHLNPIITQIRKRDMTADETPVVLRKLAAIQTVLLDRKTNLEAEA